MRICNPIPVTLCCIFMRQPMFYSSLMIDNLAIQPQIARGSATTTEMLIDPDTPVYELIDNRAYSHSHSMAHQTSHIGLASPHIPVPAGDQLGEEGSTHSLFRKRQFFFQDWIAELIALLFAAVSLTTISVLLIAYHGRPVNSLPQGITLNAVVALLTAAYKAALLFTVSSAIGQSKWNMFSTQPRVFGALSTSMKQAKVLGEHSTL